MSLALVAAFMAVSKAYNPALNIKPIIVMFGAVAVGCFVMTVISGRNRNDE
jgi:hypothetical protein